MKKVDYEAYLNVRNPVKNKEALFLETLSQMLNNVDDVVIHCIRLLVGCYRDRLIRRNDWELVTLGKHSYFMPRILPEEYRGNKYLYARRNSMWIPTDYYGQSVLISALSCRALVLEKARLKIENQEETPFQKCVYNTLRLSFLIALVTPFIQLCGVFFRYVTFYL